MDLHREPNTESVCSQKVKRLGWQLSAFSIFAMLSGLISIGNLGNEGELGRFAHDTIPLLLCVVGWGLSTGIGLLRKWRWARVSMLVFSSFPIFVGVLLAAGLLLFPKGDVPWHSFFLLKAFVVSLGLIPIAIGVRWVKYFRRDDVKAYFRASINVAG